MCKAQIVIYTSYIKLESAHTAIRLCIIAAMEMKAWVT